MKDAVDAVEEPVEGTGLEIDLGDVEARHVLALSDRVVVIGEGVDGDQLVAATGIAAVRCEPTNPAAPVTRFRIAKR